MVVEQTRGLARGSLSACRRVQDEADVRLLLLLLGDGLTGWWWLGWQHATQWGLAVQQRVKNEFLICRLRTQSILSRGSRLPPFLAPVTRHNDQSTHLGMTGACTKSCHY